MYHRPRSGRGRSGFLPSLDVCERFYDGLAKGHEASVHMY
jgi:hypothetical protein